MVDKINDVVENITTTASDAVQHAMEPAPKPGPEQVAGTTKEQVYIAEATDPAPLILSKPALEKKRKVPVKLAPSKVPPKKVAAKKASKKSSKKDSNEVTQETCKEGSEEIARRKVKESSKTER